MKHTTDVGHLLTKKQLTNEQNFKVHNTVTNDALESLQEYVLCVYDKRISKTFSKLYLIKKMLT